MSSSRRQLFCAAVLAVLMLPLPSKAANESTPVKAAETTIPENSSHDSSNAQQAIRITADSAEQDDREGVTVYSGNVVIEQGNLQIDADQVTIRSKVNDEAGNRKVDVIVATGNPARFQQSESAPKASQKATEAATLDTIDASAETIHYWLNKGVIKLEKNATINQHGSSVSGDEIEYFIDRQKVKAKADPSQPKGRVQTIIAPEAIRQDDSEQTNGDS